MNQIIDVKMQLKCLRRIHEMVLVLYGSVVMSGVQDVMKELLIEHEMNRL